MALSERDTIVVFGGTGFVGHYLIQQLARSGAKIVIVSRSPELSEKLKVSGYAGRITLVQITESREEELLAITSGATYVINLIGILRENKGQTFKDTHVGLARKIARTSRKNGAKRLIHFSALGVDKSMSSKYAITKLEGEKAVLNEDNDAVILRPSIIFGAEDNFINLFAKIIRFSPIIPLVGGGHTKIQPIYVENIADLIVELLKAEPKTVQGKLFEAGGSKIYTLKEILNLLLQSTGKSRSFITVPFSLMKFSMWPLRMMPGMITQDQIEMLKFHNIVGRTNAVDFFRITPNSLQGYLEYTVSA